MSIFSSKDNLMFDTSVSDLCVRSILDMGFELCFEMSPTLHNHSYYELLFAAEGSFFIRLSDGSKINLDEGDFCLIPPSVYHSTCPNDEGSKKLGLRFRYEKSPHITDNGSVYGIFHKTMTSCKDAVLIRGQKDMSFLFTSLRRELIENRIAKQEFVITILNQLYLLLLRKINDFGKSSVLQNDSDYCDELELRRVGLESYFEQYFDQPVTEEHLASKMHLSKRQVSRILQKIYQKSFRQLLIDMRINQATQLLKSTELSLDDISVRVGYTSLSGFCSAFYNVHGMTPGRYRQQNIDNS